MKRRARRAPISGRSAPSVRARRAHPGTHPPPSIRPRPLQIPSSRPSAGTQSPRKSGTFSKPRSGTFSTPIDTALLGRVSRFRAMPVGDRRSSDAGRRPPPGELASAPCGGRRCWGGFRAHARCRSETGAPAMPAGGAHRENWPALQATPTGCRNSTPYTKSPPGGGCHGERRLPLPVGFRPIATGVR